jgi:hypothetical protein
MISNDRRQFLDQAGVIVTDHGEYECCHGNNDTGSNGRGRSRSDHADSGGRGSPMR